MKIITFNDPHRQKHFEFFAAMNHPHFNITVEVELTNFLPFVQQEALKFTTAIVFVMAKAANAIKEFRWRIRKKQVVEHTMVHPSFTVHTKASSVFSFCTVPFQNDLHIFLNDTQQIMNEMQNSPSFEDEPGRDDYLFMSSIPWFSFKSIQHAMHYHPCDSVPRFTFGKYFESGNIIKMPLSIQAHHALVNGKEVGEFIDCLQHYLHNPKNLLKDK